MAASVVLPLESRIQQWHDTEHKFQLRPTLSETPRLLSDSMARPLPAAEPREDAFSRRPSLPPFSKFLSDAGHPELFTQPRTPQIRTEPSLSAGAALNSHVIQLNSFRPSELHSGARTEQLPPTRNGHTEMQNGRTWSYPSTSPVGSHLSIPGTAPTKMSGDRATGPAVLREEVIPGRGPCYVYEDGAVVQKIINGDTVNPKWGTTKAGKPRKRLGQACNTCREKKIKCDPSVPKCAQCQKFGRECKFDSTSRSGPRQPGSVDSMAMSSPGTSPGYIQQEHPSRRGSTASTDLVPQEHPFPRAGHRSSAPLENLLSPTSRGDIRDESPDSRPPAKKLRVSLSPRAASDSWPTESVASRSAPASIASPLVMPRFCWQADPYQLDREMTMYYTNKYFHHVDSATTCILPRKAFLRWIRESTTKSPTDKMVLYAILAMGTVFAQRPEAKQHQDVFIDIVNHAVMKGGDTFSLQLVQTKLILALFTFSKGQYNQAWDFCGSALRVAFGLKFNTEEGVAAIGDNNGLDFGLDYATLKECRRRTFWSAYIMDCFNWCCSASVTSISRSDCHLRLPCSQSAYDKGEIPVTSFTLDSSRNHLDRQPGSRSEISEVGVLGYLVEIATIFNEVVSRIGKSTPQTSEEDRLSMETFHRDTLQRLEAWDKLMNKCLDQGRDGKDPVNGLHILYHYTAMILHRYVRFSEIGHLSVGQHVREAHKHARLMLEMVQRLSNHEERETPSFRFATLSPFSGFAITAALDTITAAGTMANLRSHTSQLMSLIASGVEALEGLVDSWHSARRQDVMIKQRLSALLTATTGALDCNGGFYFAQPMQSPFGLDQDIVYGLSRPRYFEAQGWDERIHHEEDFRRLD